MCIDLSQGSNPVQSIDKNFNKMKDVQIPIGMIDSEALLDISQTISKVIDDSLTDDSLLMTYISNENISIQACIVSQQLIVKKQVIQTIVNIIYGISFIGK